MSVLLMTGRRSLTAVSTFLGTGQVVAKVEEDAYLGQKQEHYGGGKLV
jgi:hypothetical protein